jgi:hypothetical protein
MSTDLKSMLFEQLSATNEVARAAHQAGYERGRHDGYMEAMDTVSKMLDKMNKDSAPKTK